jgi:hypothetical protein
VSDVVGFVLVFSLVTTTVGVVYVAGIGGLEDARDAEQLNNVERAFDVLADNLEDIHRDNAPNRATEFRLYEATLELGAPTDVSVEWLNNDTDTTNPVPGFGTDTSPIVYTPQSEPSSSVLYTGGAVIREDRSGAVIIDEPPFAFDDNGGVKTAVIPVVDTRSPNREYVVGTSTVLIRTERIGNEVLAARTDPSSASTDVDTDDADVEYEIRLGITTTPARADAWVRYLNDEIPDSFDANDIDGDTDVTDDPVCERNGDQAICVIATERLYVTTSRIDVSIES